MNASTMFKSKWRDSSLVHHYLEKELLESSKPSLGEWQDKHTHIKYALCTKIKLSSFLHIFAAISYCLMPQIVVRGHPLGGSSTAHAPCRVSYGSFTNYLDKARLVGHTGNVKDMQIFPYNSKGNSFKIIKEA